MKNGAMVFQSEDFKKLSRGLRAMGKEVASDELLAGLKSGADIIAAEARRLVPVGKKDKGGKYPHEAGALRDSIQAIVGKTRESGERKFIVMAGSYSIFYPWWVEFGHKATKATAGQRRLLKVRKKLDSEIEAAKRGLKSARKPRSLRRVRKRLAFLLGVKAGKITDTRADVAPRPFMRPAFDNKKAEAAAAVETHLKNGIEARFGRLF